MYHPPQVRPQPQAVNEEDTEEGAHANQIDAPVEAEYVDRPSLRAGDEVNILGREAEGSYTILRIEGNQSEMAIIKNSDNGIVSCARTYQLEETVDSLARKLFEDEANQFLAEFQATIDHL